ncbi:MAG: YebC/PmpR family DNA-binding transcriptional regulator [Planctomycetaceae bacterium]
MAGHSHAANIAHRKGRVDKLRGKLFGKLSRAIIVAAQRGGGDPAANMTLRIAIEKARKQSMPKDNIERAIKKGTGEASGEAFQELLYEGYGPAGVAIICDALSDNRNRTAGEIRKIFEVHGGNLGSTNCVSYLFERKGVFIVPQDKTTEEQLFELVIEAGAEDLQRVSDQFEVTSAPELFQDVSSALEAAGIETTTSEISRVPSNTVDVTGNDARRVLKLIDALEENDDIQSVTANYNIPDEELTAIYAEQDG